MIQNLASKERFFKLLLICNLILFTEIFSFVFIVFPSSFLTQNIYLFVFYLFLIFYFIFSLIIPWLFMFFNNIPKFIFITFGVSITIFCVYLLINFVFKFSLQVIFDFILLKSFMAGLALFFKVLTSPFLLTNTQTVNFSFQNNNSTIVKQRNATLQNNPRLELFYSFLFLLLYPLIIIVMIYFFT